MNEEELAALEDELAYGAPPQEKKDDVYKFFRDMIKSEDTTKFGNMKPEELGYPSWTFRGLKDISSFANSMGLECGDYLADKAENIASSSLSKNALLAQLVVTQIKKTRTETGNQPKPGLFNFGKKKVEE